MLLSELDELLVLDATRANKNHAVGSVVRLDVGRQILASDRADVLLGAKNRSAKGLA